MNVQLSSRSDEWFTPPDIIDRVHTALGGIVLDPASSATANVTVGAERYITREENGLVTPWGEPESVFLNPPGGKTGNRSNAQLFWEHLIGQTFGHAVYMGFSLEQMQTTQRNQVCILDFPFCVPRKRIRFVSPSGEKNSPCHSNVIVYIPAQINRTPDFINAFEDLGYVKL